MKNRRYGVFLAGFLCFLPLLTSAGPKKIEQLDCFIEPFYVVNLGSEVPAVITEILVDRNDFVEKGQVLVKLDSKVEEQTVELKKARLEFAIREHKRRNELFQKDLIAARDADESETTMKMAQRELQESEEVLARRTIRSTINGVVVQRFLSPGDRVEQQPVLKLAQLSPLNVEVIAPATMLGSVKVGDRAAVKPENPIKGEYIGRVSIVDHVIDAASGTLGIRIEIENKDYSLPAGLKCQVRFLGK